MQNTGSMLNVALPKGRLGDSVYRLFAQMGYDCPHFFDGSRKLVVENQTIGVRYFLVKPSDVAIYVQRGAADIGVVGKDTLLETQPDVYELADLGLGKCHVAVAGAKDFIEDRSATLRVATKYVNITKKYFAEKSREIEIIKLNGSIELAPILGLSDVIVDIVETGSTLRENNLCVLKEILPISARLIANKAGYKFKAARIDAIRTHLQTMEVEES